MKNVEPRGKIARGVAASRSGSRPGFTVELAAAEPLVKDPIAFEWGADGKLWVVEMGDYPLGVDGKGKPGGVVRFLEDTDGDGRYDKQTTFLDGLGFPTGVMPWRNGVLVACAPDIFYAEDRDGDGKADHREVLFTGFGEGNQQHRFNGFELGLDGWVYGANGDSGGTIRSLKTGQITPISGRDFRFRPDTGEFEAESGQTQYGRHRDDWGHWFGNNNPNWGWHYVLADHDLEAQPVLCPPRPAEDARARHPGLSDQPHARRGSTTWTAANHVTSANSPTPYRDELFGPWFATSLFVSEPVHNLVHRMVLEPDGVSFRGRRGPDEAGREFLASSDNWFRPTMLKTGPDGCLWIADMYRCVIEHPEWIPDDWEEAARPPGRQRAGADLSRLSGRARSRGQSPGWTSSIRPGSWPRSIAPAAGSATRPSGCSCTAAIPPRSRRCELSCNGTQAAQDARAGDLDAGRSAVGSMRLGPGRPHRSDARVRESVIAAVGSMLGRRPTRGRRSAPAGRRRRCPRPVPGRAGAGQLG